MSPSAKLFFIVAIELYLISLGKQTEAELLRTSHSHIGCFVCSSRNGSDPDCEDPFHPGNMNGSYQEKCKVPKRKHVGEFPAHFCVKIIGRSYETDEKVVIRRCVIHTMENQCGNFQLDDELLRGCVLSCSLHGCNSAHSTASSWLTLLFGTSTSLILAIKGIGAKSHLGNVT